MSSFQNIDGLLIDVDGVLFIGDAPIPGAIEALHHLADRGIPHRFVTNRTTLSRRSLHEFLARLGLPIRADQLVTTPVAAASFLRQWQEREGRPPRVWLLLNDDTKEDLDGFPVEENHPDWIVMGDNDDKWDYELLQRVFRAMLGGAGLLALHRGRYWQEPDGLRLDIGCFVTGLEFVTGQKAAVMGKPEPEIFLSAARGMGVEPDRCAMIGDDIINDVMGAQRAGMRGWLVQTGKYRPDLVARSGVTPDALLPTIAALLEM